MQLQHVDDWSMFDGGEQPGDTYAWSAAGGSGATTRRASRGRIPRVVSRGVKWQRPSEAESRYGGNYRLECPPIPKRLKALGMDIDEWTEGWYRNNDAALVERESVSTKVENCVGVHWIGGTFPDGKRQALRCILKEQYGPSNSADHSFNGYTHGEHWGEYASLLWVQNDASAFKRQGGTCCLIVRGSGCDAIADGAKLLNFMRRLSRLGFHPTRLDTFFDDGSKRILPEDIERQVVAGELSVVGFRKMHRDSDFDLGLGQYDGSGVRFGKRGDNGGGKVFRIYRKDLESEGARDCVRFEAEWTKEYAVQVFNAAVACASVADLCIMLGEAIGGVASFREGLQGEDRHAERRRVVSWWASIISEIGSLPFSLAQKVSTVAKAAKWLFKQASGSLALVREFCEMVEVPFDVVLRSLGTRPLSPRQEYVLMNQEPIPDEVLDCVSVAPF